MDQQEKPAVIKPELKGPVIIELFYPVKVGASEDAEVISSLTFRRPKGGDMCDMPAKATVGDLVRLACRLCNQPAPVIKALEIPDFNRVTKAVGDFLDDGQSTGETA